MVHEDPALWESDDKQFRANAAPRVVGGNVLLEIKHTTEPAIWSFMYRPEHKDRQALSIHRKGPAPRDSTVEAAAEKALEEFAAAYEPFIRGLRDKAKHPRGREA